MDNLELTARKNRRAGCAAYVTTSRLLILAGTNTFHGRIANRASKYSILMPRIGYVGGLEDSVYQQWSLETHCLGPVPGKDEGLKTIWS